MPISSIRKNIKVIHYYNTTKELGWLKGKIWACLSVLYPTSKNKLYEIVCGRGHPLVEILIVCVNYKY